ncbi:MAG: hypothetical protein PHP93_08620, partial [Kiritimatiellales bacterium]|nr:hypothetical protein [Kiritimatiellales bacterium]
GLSESVDKYGYYGGLRLIEAALKRFFDYTRETGTVLEAKNFSLRYFSNIPPHVGMAGSSAIVTACFRGLMQFYNIEIPQPLLANLILSVEKDELGISAGLQDRVAQVYQGLVYMDFDRAVMDKQGWGNYESLPPATLPPVYIAYRTELAESSDVFHNDIRGRYGRDEPEVVDAMTFWADLTVRARAALLAGRAEELAELMNANFDRRREIYQIHPDNIAMIEAARSAGASAKFTGSGGAIVGTFRDETMFTHLRRALEPLGVHVLKPDLI